MNEICGVCNLYNNNKCSKFSVMPTERFPKFKKVISVEAIACGVQEMVVVHRTTITTPVHYGIIVVNPLFIYLGINIFILNNSKIFAKATSENIVVAEWI